MRRLASAAAAALCAGCLAQPSPPLSTAPATISAGGRAILVAPPEGRCVSAGATEAAALVMGCDGAGPVTGVSVGPEPLFGGAASDAAFASLAQWAQGPAGGRALAMDEGAPPVRLTASRREGDALFLMLEEAEGAAPRRFCRAFTEINDRITMVSVHDVNGDGAPVDEAAMMALAREQLAALRAANPATPPAQRVAATPAAPRVATTPPAGAPRPDRLSPPPARPRI